MSDPAGASGDPLPPMTPSEPATASGTDLPQSPVFFPGPVAARSAAPAGPGLLESLLWIVGFFAIELFGSFIWVVGALAVHSIGEGGMVQPSKAEELLQPVMPWMIGSLKLLEVIAVVVALRLRFGPGAFRVTGFRPVSTGTAAILGVPLPHALILAFAVLPTAFLSGQSYALFKGYWDAIAKDVPFLSSLEDLSSIEAVQEMAESTPLVALVFVIAVLPALNEEFLFRAALGRGLLARYGLVAGIALTSMLFAAVHLSPIHAAALLPLALLMHVGYLSSRSIWACVGVHFANNALSVAMMKLATVDPKVAGMTADVTDTKFSPLLFISSAACVAVAVWLLWRIRLRWRLPDGREWRTAFPSVEPPPDDVAATASVPPLSAGPLWIAAACYAAFPVVFAISVMLDQV